MDSFILIVIILGLTVSSANSQTCPKGCTCPSNVINCARVSGVPNLSGTTQSFLNIYEAYLPNIPPNAFRDNPNLSSISIYRATIGRIMNCAFNGLRELSSISIYQSNVTTIESGAFGNMTFDTESRIAIYSLFISTIEPFAFSSFESDGSFNLYQANITTIKPFAFHNLTLQTFSIYSSNISVVETYAFSNFSGVRNVNLYLNTIGLLRCDSISNLMANPNGRPNINRIDLNCDCNLAWLVLSNITLEPSVTCFKPPALLNREIRNLNVTDVCPSGNYSTTCPKPNVSQPGPCPVPTSTANRIEIGAVLMITLIPFFVVTKLP